MKRIIAIALLATSLTGCASFAERVAECQKSGADANTCAQIVQAQDAQFAASMQQMSANFQAQQNAQMQQQALNNQAAAMNNIAFGLQNQNVTLNRGYGW